MWKEVSPYEGLSINLQEPDLMSSPSLLQTTLQNIKNHISRITKNSLIRDLSSVQYDKTKRKGNEYISMLPKDMLLKKYGVTMI